MTGFSGCAYNRNRQVIEDVDFIRAIGIDYQNETFEVSAILTDDPTIYKGYGTSIYEAYDQLMKNHKRQITLTQTSYYFLGEQACEVGLDSCLNFFIHQESVQMNAYVFVTRNETATQFLQDGFDKELTVYDEFDAITLRQVQRYTKMDNTIAGLFKNMVEERECVMIPYTELSNEEFTIGGYSVFVGNTLYDYLTYEISLGVDLLRNRIHSYPILLTGVSLRVIDSKTKIDLIQQKDVTDQTAFLSQDEPELPEGENETLAMKISVSFDSEIVENLGNEMNYPVTVQLQENYVRDLILDTIDYVKVTGADIINAEGIIRKQNETIYQHIKADRANRTVAAYNTYLQRLLTHTSVVLKIKSNIKRSFIDYQARNGA